jgi:inhibitor of cysteine peptidase
MRTFLVILILATSIFTACKINEKSNSDALKADYEIPVNGTFQLSLASNISTGYSWVWTNRQSVSIVDTFDFNYITDHPDRIGGGGKELWNFRGRKSGFDTIVLEYKRVWETIPAFESKKVVVRVK